MKKLALQQLAYETTNLYASALPGEAFHKVYQKDPELFRLLVRSDNVLERKLRAYFKELAGKMKEYVNWNAYEVELMKGSIADMITAEWSQEQLSLKVILTDALVYAISAGGLQTEQDTRISIGWGDTDPEAIKFLDGYSLKLAGNLTDTTLKSIKSAIRMSLSNGETTPEAIARVGDVIDNPVRAAMIAHTESVRAYSYGRLEVASRVGADRKKWDATLNACAICRPLDGTVIGLDKQFETDLGPTDAPPAHPNCRCIVQILMPGEE